MKKKIQGLIVIRKENKKSNFKVKFVNLEKRKNSTVSWIRKTCKAKHCDNSECDYHQPIDLKSFFSKPLRSRSPQSNTVSCKRLDQPRLSLLGKPIVYKPIKSRDPRYRRLQTRTHNLLERPRGAWAALYHLSL